MQANCQLEIIVGRVILPEGAFARGDIVWTTENNARHYIEQKIAKVLGKIIQPGAGPTEVKPAGPSEVKKSLPADPDGRSTDSAASSAPGQAEPSSAAPEAVASTSGKPTLLQRGRNALIRPQRVR